MSNIIMVTGGSRSGKSSFAEEFCIKRSGKLAYIATAEALDEEMKKRIELHQERRGTLWETFEIPLDISSQIQLFESYDFVLLDCLTMLIANKMFSFGENIDDIDKEQRLWIEEKTLRHITDLIQAMKSVNTTFVIVTNEIGLGIVPESKLTRLYRDIVGKSNQLLAAAAKEVYLVISGIPLQIKGAV